MSTDLQPFEKRMNELLRVDPTSAVVLTVDMQRDYLDLEVASSPVLESEAERVLRSTRDLLTFARGLGIPEEPSHDGAALSPAASGSRCIP